MGLQKGRLDILIPMIKISTLIFWGGVIDSLSVTPPAGGFADIRIAAAWDNQMVPDKSLLGKLLKKAKPADIDLDLGSSI